MAGFAREQGETGTAWLQRVARAGTIRVDRLEALLAAHYRLRFDPAGVSPEERRQLRRGVDEWLYSYHKADRARGVPH